MLSRSNSYPFLKIIPFVLALVVGVRPLASQQLTEAQFIASVNTAIQPLLSETPGQPIIMSANLEFAHGGFIPHIDISVLLAYVDGLKAAGVQRIEFNPGYLSLQDPGVMAKYDQLVQHIRQLGLMLAINTEYVQTQQPVTNFQQFQSTAVAGAQQIAARYKPDNFVIVHEPDTMAQRMGIQTTVQDWEGFIQAVAPGIRASSPHTRLGAGCYYGATTQTLSNLENAYFQGFATLSDLDFLTMDIYDDTTFNQFVTWTQLAHSVGKGAYIEETWIPHYFANGFPANLTGPLDNAATVGPDSADFASLFPSWLHAMALFASANGMEAMTAYTTPAFFQYGTPGADIPDQTAYATAVFSAIANGQLTSTGQAYLTYSQQLGVKVAASLSSASYATLSSVFCSPATNPCNADSTVAPAMIVSAFGADLANQTIPSSDWPTTLGNTTGTLVDSLNASFPLQVYSVSPSQVNYLVPNNAAPGAATLTIKSGDGTVTTGIVLVAAVQPGLYTADSNGKGAAAGFAICAGACAGWSNRQANGQAIEILFTPSGGQPQPINLGAPTDTVVLELFGTGLRHASSASAVTALINGQSVPVQFAGEQGQFTGEDQVNVQLPHSLAGSGIVNLVLTVSDTVDNTTPSSNAVTIDIE